MTTFEKRRGGLPAVGAVVPRPFAVRRSDSLDHLVRAAVTLAYAQSNQTSIEYAQAMLAQKHARYNDEVTKYVCRAAVSPATTIDEGWAAELVVAEGADLIAALMPKSAFAQLGAQGMHLTFGEGDILVPNFFPSSAGAFVRQGDPIPVIQGQTTGQLLTRKKLAAIVAYTGEMNEGGIVPFEGLLRTRIQETMTVTIDGVLLDDQPASDARPAGLLNGGVQVTTTGTLLTDLQLLAENLYPVAGNHVRVPVLIMNSAQAFATWLQVDRGGEFIPVIMSPNIPPGTVIMLDAADFACAGGQVPRVEVSKEAALHFEDAAPQHINPGSMSSPSKSLWQEELLGLRIILQLDWCLRRPGVVSYMRDIRWAH